jgi:mRNA-degrading endonuclease RelE of RelBE toxin-antitoxin system
VSSCTEFTIVYAPEVLNHLDAIEGKYHRLIRRVVGMYLSRHADVATKNRKPLEEPAPFGATWELRFGPNNRFRCFYDIDSETCTVSILAVGVKVRSRLTVGEEEFEP